MSLRLRNVQVDVPADRYDAACTFWADALGATTRAGDGPYTHLVDPHAPVGVHVQRLGEGPARMHLDLESSDPDAVVARLVAGGASRAWDAADGPGLRDPADLRFCVVPYGSAPTRRPR